MDLEEIARRLFNEQRTEEDIIRLLQASGRDGLSRDYSKALLTEIRNSEELPGLTEELKDLINYRPTGLSAGTSGLGSRGEGDFMIHRFIARVAGPGEESAASPPPDSHKVDDSRMVIGPEHQDDGGAVRIDEHRFLVVSIDGLHSRLGHFPFLAGFHVARACLRDVLVMGAEPVALFSDVHLGNDGDPAVLLDYTAGIATVGELLGVPLVAGSTLRIGGDLVTGDRLSGAAGAVGISQHLTPRKNIEPGDLLVMTTGNGGGTIAATAIFHGQAAVLEETLNIDFLRFTKEFLGHPVIGSIHAMTDVTNGGIRGDLHEMAAGTGMDIVLYEEEFLSLINPRVRTMLQSLAIDPMGVSIDSLLVVCPHETSLIVLDIMKEKGMNAGIVGRVEEDQGNEREQVQGKGNENEKRKGSGTGAGTGFWGNGKRKGRVFIQGPDARDDLREMDVRFREAPYTPVKKVVDDQRMDLDVVRRGLESAARDSLQKKEWLKKRLDRNPEIRV